MLPMLDRGQSGSFMEMIRQDNVNGIDVRSFYQGKDALMYGNARGGCPLACIFRSGNYRPQLASLGLLNCSRMTLSPCAIADQSNPYCHPISPGALSTKLFLNKTDI